MEIIFYLMCWQVFLKLKKNIINFHKNILSYFITEVSIMSFKNYTTLRTETALIGIYKF